MFEKLIKSRKMHDLNDQTDIFDTSQQIDRVKLKEERKVRNKQKKELRRNQKQMELEQVFLMKLQSKSNNVTLITRDFANKVVRCSATTSNQSTPLTDVDFPALGSKCKLVNTLKSAESDDSVVKADNKQVLNLLDFLHKPQANKTKSSSISSNKHDYIGGNPLDSDMPIRRRGKVQEVSPVKRKSKIKQEILKEQSEIIELSQQQDYYKELCDNIITDELNNLVTTFITSLVRLQEKLYQRDPLKGKSKRRYVVGLHEVMKYLKLNKIKIVVIAPDVKTVKPDGALNCVIMQIIELAKSTDITHLFALKRRTLGVLTLKYIPVTVVGVLNYEGLEDAYTQIIKVLPPLKSNLEQNYNLKDVKQDNTQNEDLLDKFLTALKSE